ncbi:MAG: AAA family ATPase [Chloroflexi bacterium]|nr:AAA family ATPase [Chloroflexota bacterium]
MPDDLQDIAEALSRPEAYPFPTDRVEVLQTHISWVFLAGEFAYKVKKPVNLGFLDFTTLEGRKEDCEREVRLNRRLAPDVYRGVVPIVLTPKGPQVEADGEPVEYAVKMVRVPHERMFDQLLARNQVSRTDLQRLAQLIARFHEQAITGDDINAVGVPGAIDANWQENFEQAPDFASPKLRAFVERQLRRQVWQRRIEHGRIRDCHGDLRAESVYLGEDGRLEVLDCIEFNDRFRYGDVASEVAFLAMDLDWRGRPDLAWSWVQSYIAESGDAELEEVLPFYKCYRAFVRGKVEHVAAQEPEVPEPERRQHEQAAREHFRLAELYATDLPPVLIMAGGQVGSGKSTLAHGVASLLGLRSLSSDVIRKELAGIEATNRGGPGMYSNGMTSRTYTALARGGQSVLEGGKAVVLDATYGNAKKRAQAVAAANRAGVPYVFLEASTPDSLIRQRLRNRTRDKAEVSDADERVYEASLAAFEPPSELDLTRCIRVDMSGAIGPAVDAAARAVLDLARR